MKKNKCEYCRFYVKPHFYNFFEQSELGEFFNDGLTHEQIQKKADEEHETGECVRFPPPAIDYGPDKIAVTISRTYRDWWCGEYRKKRFWQ